MKRPEWLDSIRAILALILVMTYCISVFFIKIPAERLQSLEKLAMLSLTFYYLKQRKEG